MSRKRRKFSNQFKADAVALVLVSGKSVTQVSKDLDLSASSLSGWIASSEARAGQKKVMGPLDLTERAELELLRDDVRVLRLERDFPKKSGGLLRETKHMKFAFIAAEKACFTIVFMCEQLGVSVSGYFAWCARALSAHAVDDVMLTKEIRASHDASRRTYGSPRVHRDLRARGRCISRKRVVRLMRSASLKGTKRRRFQVTTDSNHEFDVAPNLVKRNFDVDAPNRCWVTDITYIATTEGWLYLAAIVDLFSRRVVGWAASGRIDTKLCLDALDAALAARGPVAGLVHHSDRGIQYASNAYRRALKAAGITCSMSRKGDCWDNAVAESFWSTLKTELVGEQVFPTRAAARLAIFDYIEVFYNRRRRHSTINYETPAEREAQYSATP
ncbi:MAG: IS3 family transposase [Deltaproteobacteria bacterium]|nr:IS3 family transposase [Deltaproteobacteria bacterium]